MMNRGHRQHIFGGGNTNIPSLLDGNDANVGGQSSGYGNSFGINQSSSYGSSTNQSGYSSNQSLGYGGGTDQSLGYGSSYSSTSQYGGLSSAKSLSMPVGYSSRYTSGSDGLLGKGGSSGDLGGLLGNRNSSDGLLGNGLGSSGFGGGRGILGSGLGSSGFGSSGSFRSGDLGGEEGSFAAKVWLQQAMLAEERKQLVGIQQKSVQQQIEEQLEIQNRKRLEYNRMKREREHQRHDSRRRDDHRNDDRSRRGSKDAEGAGGLDDVHVTIKPRSEGRAVSDSTGSGRKRNLSDRSRNQQTGAQSAKKTQEGDNSTSDANSTLPGPWKCHVCVVVCRDLKGYEVHMKGRMHSDVMERMRRVTEFQARQAVQRLEVQNHLKKVQGRNKDEDDHYCRDCLTDYSGDLLAHRRTKEHKESRKTQRPHCRVCNVTFKTPKKYVAHCNTPGHKKVYEAAKARGDKGIDPENFVTVDSIGVCDDEDIDDEALLSANVDDATQPKGNQESKDGAMSEEENMQTDLGDGFDLAIKITKASSEDDVVVDSDPDASPIAQAMSEYESTTQFPPCESASDIFASSADEGTINDLVTAHLVSETDAMATDDGSSTVISSDDVNTVPAKVKKEEEQDQDLSEYDPNKPVGRHHVVPVWGYFCKPCCKFYQSVGSQEGVLDAHCKTREHYDAIKNLLAKGKDFKDELDEDDTDNLSRAIALDEDIND